MKWPAATSGSNCSTFNERSSAIMQMICRMSCYVGLTVCALLPICLSVSPTPGAMSNLGSLPNMGVGTLLTLLVATVGLACVWWQLLSMRAFGELVSMTGISMLDAIPVCRPMLCGGASRTDMAIESSRADYEAMAEACPLVIIDLCAALSAPRMHLQAAIEVLAEQGVEVAIYSALPAWNTRAALRAAGMMEWFDYVWHLDAMGEMDAFEYTLLQVHGVLSTPEQLKMKPLMSTARVPPNRVPAWMRWLA